MPHTPKDVPAPAATAARSGSAGRGGRERCARDISGAQEPELVCRVRGFYVPGSGHAAKGPIAGIAPACTRPKQKTA
jgi:hypothetical protein